MGDAHDLDRFVRAQATTFDAALQELRAGHKRTHWMWFVFPQLRGLGHSETARYFGIDSIAEARAYLVHDVLGPRLVECCQAILDVPGRTAHDIFGSPDDVKLRSSMTLFASAAPGSIFETVLDKYFEGSPDSLTIGALGS
jgi:uncharacterized protein (DUF1810 family)